MSSSIFSSARRQPYITSAVALEWATSKQNASPTHHAKRLSMVRLFAEFRKLVDPRTEVPPRTLLPYRPKRAVPHIYSQTEIARLLNAFLNLDSTELRRRTYYTIFGLLVVTGCRAGEILGLKHDDVDRKRGILTIRLAKFGKSRLVPLRRSTTAALREYVKVRGAFVKVPTDYFFVSSLGNRVDYGDFKGTFIAISRKVGLRGLGSSGPRIHDLRHSFAVRTILCWYKSGANVEASLPLLSTYLGHVKATDTYWYLTAVPELLRLAAARLDNKGRTRHE